MNEPVALRYDFDGNGYLYMDAGSGSDWASRVKNCEFLYTHPLTYAEPIAWMHTNSKQIFKTEKPNEFDLPLFTPLYTHPPIKETIFTNIDFLENCIEKTQQIANLHQEIYLLKEALQDCTCQGGHSEAYLKAKGKL